MSLRHGRAAIQAPKMGGVGLDLGPVPNRAEAFEGRRAIGAQQAGAGEIRSSPAGRHEAGRDRGPEVPSRHPDESGRHAGGHEEWPACGRAGSISHRSHSASG